MVDKLLQVDEGGILAATNSFFKSLLEKKSLDALIVPQEEPSKKMVFPVMTTAPDKLNANIFAPVIPVSTATILSQLTRIQSSEKMIGIVMRPCQIRAAVELIKLKQINRENIVIIGIDCLGTFPLNTYTDFPEDITPMEYILDNKNGGKYLRSACSICKDPVPINADITICLFGMDRSKELVIRFETELGEKLILDLPSWDKAPLRDKAVEEIRKEKNDARSKFMSEKSAIKGIDMLAEFFDKCINCHNCMNVCPICYCKECLFDSAVFDLEAYKFIAKANKKGLFKMPADSILFHITRMNHMILSCIQCGLCEQACPSNIPLLDLLVPVAEKAQSTFNYSPGKDSEEKLPLAVYREEEYQNLGVK